MKFSPDHATLAALLLVAGFVGLSFFQTGSSTCSLIPLPAFAPDPTGTVANWSFRDEDNAAVTPRDFPGTVQVVNFWATWCPNCRGEMPALVALQSSLGPRGLQVVSVNLDDGNRAGVAAVAAQAGLNFPVLFPADDGPSAFGSVHAIPTTFVVAPDGTILERIVGPIDPAALEARVLPHLAAL